MGENGGSSNGCSGLQGATGSNGGGGGSGGLWVVGGWRVDIVIVLRRAVLMSLLSDSHSNGEMKRREEIGIFTLTETTR